MTRDEAIEILRGLNLSLGGTHYDEYSLNLRARELAIDALKGKCEGCEKDKELQICQHHSHRLYKQAVSADKQLNAAEEALKAMEAKLEQQSQWKLKCIGAQKAVDRIMGDCRSLQAELARLSGYRCEKCGLNYNFRRPKAKPEEEKGCLNTLPKKS